MAGRAALPLCEALANGDPRAMLERATQIEEVLPREEVDARSLWLDAQIRAATALGRSEEALALRLRRYLEEPVSSQTPLTLPAGSIATSEQLLARAELLLDAHRNTRVLEALADISEHELSAEQKCHKAFIHGLAARKLRRYAEAERNLERAVEMCADEDLTRRAMYLLAKVVSIHAGLRAVPIIESFVKRFAGHSMVDDVLFWAGDMYQRRKRWTEAERYYRRIEKLPHKGDYCGEARWRLAWMAYRRDRMRSAQATLQRFLADDGCAPLRFDRARAHYWSARIYARLSDLEAAQTSYRRAINTSPLGYYAQLGLTRLADLAPQDAQQIVARLPAPQPVADVELCPGFLAGKRAFSRGVELLVRGLRSDAADELRTIEVPEQRVLAQTHAVALGLAAEPVRPVEPVSEHGQGPCTRERAILSLALLLDRAGAHREAHWRLRTDFADTLASFPTPKSHAVWLAAYPLAFREQIKAGEKESGLPELFLQALSREESALDPRVVSWAGAYGLTQLLLSSGQRAGKLLEPPVIVTTAEELLEPGLNARLGAALLAASWHKLGNNLGLALAAYNAGDQVALTWWKRHQGEPFDVFSEEITIKETRGYVKRVLKTFGIYRWIYAGAPPMLPVDDLPPVR
jgi:soluble lytic murein transglycosylase